VRYNTKPRKETLSRFSTVRGSFTDMRINDVYVVGELEATGSALIETHERGQDFGDWQQMRFAHGLRCKNAKDRGTKASRLEGESGGAVRNLSKAAPFRRVRLLGTMRGSV
jgi:hypothetical protein